MLLEIQVIDNPLVEQNLVLEARTSKALVDLRRHRATAHVRLFLEYDGTPSGFCEIEGSDQRVVAGADDDHVVR